MKQWIEKTTLGQRITLMTVILQVIFIVVCLFSLIKLNHLKHEIEEIGEEDVPLMRVVSEMTRYQLDQTLRFGRIIQNGQLELREKFEQEMDDFTEAGKLFYDVLKTGQRLATRAIEITISKEAKKGYEYIKNLLSKIEKEHDDYERHSQELFQKISIQYLSDKNSTQILDETLPLNDEENDDFRTFLIEHLDLVEKETLQLENEFEELLNYVDNITKTVIYEAEKETKQAIDVLTIAIIVSTSFSALMSIVIISITLKRIKRTIQTISGAAEGVTTASHEIASASQSLADEATNQAASIEETSASISEITTVAEENATTAVKSNQLIDRTNKIIEDTSRAMTEVESITGEIKVFGEEIEKVIQSLNDSTIQINLLATNASVEATRNEATKGFAIFTKEIKHLSQDIVHVTNKAGALVQNSVDNIKKNYVLTDKMKHQFDEIVTVANQLKGFSENISEASQQQSHRVSEINTAIQTLSHATQMNAASSEECAAASKDLRSQSDNMLVAVDDLKLLIEKVKEDKHNKME